MKIKKYSPILIKGLIIVLVFSGFIVNFLDFFSFNTSTLLIDIFYGINMFIYCTVYTKRKSLQINGELLFIQNFFIFLLILTFFKLLIDSNSFDERVLGYRNLILYATSILFVPSYTHKIEDIEKITSIWIYSSLIVALFAICQGVFADSLPLILLTPKSDNVFTFYEFSGVRVNGLIGNPINFTGFMLLFFSLCFNFYFYTKKNAYIFFAIISAIALYFTYSRIAYLGITIIVFFTFLLFVIKSKSFRIRFVLILFPLIIVLILLVFSLNSKSLEESFMYQRLMGKEVTTQSSNDMHLIQTFNAIKKISEHPFLGVGLGSQGESAKGLRIITDGSWFHFLLELGIPVAILYWIYLTICTIVAIRIYYSSKFYLLSILTSCYISINIFMLISGFINSIFISRIIFLQYWLLFSLIIALKSLLSTSRSIFSKI